jgi:NAD(P)-dependent dehydrogenase (short-subunit alcohol dehydrogenase family)
MTDSVRERIAVIIGSGAMGLAAARRFGPACRLLVADHSKVRLEAAVRSLADEGHRVDAMTVDVRDGSSVAAVAAAAHAAGTVTAVIHTAGVSPSQASTRDIFAIDLVGTAHVIDCFLDAASPGTSLVCVASMSGYKRRLDPALESELATIPTERLFDIRLFDLGTPDTGFAYSVAKRGVQLRVAAASLAWGRRGARVNSLSPGIICTPMSRQEFAGPRGDGMRSIVANLAVPRVGTPEDIAAAIEFLCSPAASYITGTDLLIDGGATATRHWLPRPDLEAEHLAHDIGSETTQALRPYVA